MEQNLSRSISLRSFDGCMTKETHIKDLPKLYKVFDAPICKQHHVLIPIHCQNPYLKTSQITIIEMISNSYFFLYSKYASEMPLRIQI